MRDQLHNGRKQPAASFARKCLALAVAVSVASVSPAGLAQTVSPSDAGGPSATVRRVASDAQTLHVTVGHSIFFDTKSRLRRVYIADPAILDSITLSPTQIIVTAMTPGVTSLILLDEAGQAQSYVVSSDLNVDGLRTAMSHQTLGDGIDVEGNAGRVILSGKVASDAVSDAAVKLATLYSKDVANALTISPNHPKQVRLKVRILEIDRSKLAQFGINLFNPGGNTSFLASSTTSQFPSTSTYAGGTGNLPTGELTTSSPLNFLLYSSKLNLGATVQDLESKQVLQVLAEPTLTTISGVKADFLSGGEFPFPVIQPGGAGGTASVTIQFRPYGVKVEFTPTVNEDGTIRLKVSPEVSALDYTNAVTISGYTIPALSTRRAETEVELRSEQSFAISGLLDQRTTDMLSKTPGAASIPIIGALFKSKNINHSTTELVVIVTPTLVDPLTDTTEPGQPQIPIPTLNTDTFDNSLGKRHNPTPAAPPVTTAPPFSSNQPPSIAPVSAPQTADAAVLAAPVQAVSVTPIAVAPMAEAPVAFASVPVASVDVAPVPVAPVPVAPVPAAPIAAASRPVASVPAAPVSVAAVPAASVPVASVPVAPATVANAPVTPVAVTPSAPPSTASEPSTVSQPSAPKLATLVVTPVSIAPISATPLTTSINHVPVPRAPIFIASMPAPPSAPVAPSGPASQPSAPKLATLVVKPASIAPIGATPLTTSIKPVPVPRAPIFVASMPVPPSTPARPALQLSRPAAPVAAPGATVNAAAAAVAAPPVKAVTPYSVSDSAPLPAHAANQTMVQIMALSNNQDAEAMVSALKRHGYNVAISHDPQDSLLHLEVGPFASRKDAEAMRQHLLQEGYNASVQ